MNLGKEPGVPTAWLRRTAALSTPPELSGNMGSTRKGHTLVCVWALVSRPCSLTDGRRAMGPGLRGGLRGGLTAPLPSQSSVA